MSVHPVAHPLTQRIGPESHSCWACGWFDPAGNAAARFGQAPSDFQGFDPRPAHDFLYEACAEAPGEITIIAIGPLTNLAASLKAHPDLPELAKEVLLMGGAVLGELRGNKAPAAEANFANDPEAAQAVLTAGFKKIVMADLGRRGQHQQVHVCMCVCVDVCMCVCVVCVCGCE